MDYHPNQRKKSKKKCIGAVGVLVVLVITITSIVLIFGKKNNDKEKNNPQGTEYVYIPESNVSTTPYEYFCFKSLGIMLWA